MNIGKDERDRCISRKARMKEIERLQRHLEFPDLCIRTLVRMSIVTLDQRPESVDRFYNRDVV